MSRRGGIYVVRTRRHATFGWRAMPREVGYVGRTNDFARRAREHAGRGAYRAPAKPWIDLDPVWMEIPCPPWLQGLAEWCAIKILSPRYNVEHNLSNPRRVPKRVQMAQRAERDRARRGLRGPRART